MKCAYNLKLCQKVVYCKDTSSIYKTYFPDRFA